MEKVNTITASSEYYTYSMCVGMYDDFQFQPTSKNFEKGDQSRLLYIFTICPLT